MANLLRKIYYDFKNPASFGGVATLAKQSKISQKKTKNWLASQDTYTLHKPVRVHYKTQKTLAFGPNDLFQADLVDMRHLSKYNNGYNYILTMIDVFTKFAFAIPLKNKRPESVANALKSVFQFTKPKNLQTDKGSEFYNEKCKRLFYGENINHYSSYGQTKASVVERFNRTLKNKLFRIFTYRNSYRYVDVLNDVIISYNNSNHRSIGMAPSQVTEIHHSKIFHRLYGSQGASKIFKFKIDDFVRISKMRKTFQRGYFPGWSEEVFVIHDRYNSNPPTYKLRDMKGEVIEGRFYEEELQFVKKTSKSFWSVERILDTRGSGANKEYFVKWTGFDDRFNSWIKASWVK